MGTFLLGYHTPDPAIDRERLVCYPYKGMLLATKRKRHLSFLTFVFFYLFVVASFNFFHTETTLFEDDDCPADNFQKYYFSTDIIYFYEPPIFLSLERCPEAGIPFHVLVVPVNCVVRSPPGA